ncbi:hypothetical protein ASF70_21885 [Rhizobium sp. Leaf321]|jgi:hypothetical protein|nr:hypothetical protein ASF70_21885 [Rhizobium sp. Leaf321]
MMPTWKLTKYEGAIETSQWELPAELNEAQVEEIVRRLVCCNLTEEEVINSSLPADSAKKYVLLDRNEDPTVIHIGKNPFYIAELVK